MKLLSNQLSHQSIISSIKYLQFFREAIFFEATRMGILRARQQLVVYKTRKRCVSLVVQLTKQMIGKVLLTTHSCPAHSCMLQSHLWKSARCRPCCSIFGPSQGSFKTRYTWHSTFWYSWQESFWIRPVSLMDTPH